MANLRNIAPLPGVQEGNQVVCIPVLKEPVFPTFTDEGEKVRIPKGSHVHQVITLKIKGTHIPLKVYLCSLNHCNSS